MRVLMVTGALLLLVGVGCSRSAPERVPDLPGSGGGVDVPVPGAGPVGLVDLSLAIEPLWRGFEKPVYLTHAGDGSGRLFVAEQGGAIWEIVDGTVQPVPYLDLRQLTVARGEQGLLGIAFSPGFKGDGRLYVNYTDSRGDTVIARYTADDPSSLAPKWDGPELILVVEQPYSNHNGGCLQFGPDGMLYIGMGDGGGAGDPEGNAQNLDSLLGKLLRIDVASPTGSEKYSIPADNPFVDVDGARPEVWALGLRNPWRFSFDAASGDLWIGDVGQGAWEEINHAPAQAGGLNWGWNLWEGDHDFGSREGVPRADFEFPVAEYGHDAGQSVTGGYVYRGVDYPALYGTYLYADYVSGLIGGVRLAAVDGADLSSPDALKLLDTDTRPSSFGVDEQGELYLVDHNGTIWAVNGYATTALRSDAGLRSNMR
jgi:glucose/arabinose dehydrogenase